VEKGLNERRVRIIFFPWLSVYITNIRRRLRRDEYFLTFRNLSFGRANILRIMFDKKKCDTEIFTFEQKLSEKASQSVKRSMRRKNPLPSKVYKF